MKGNQLSVVLMFFFALMKNLSPEKAPASAIKIAATKAFLYT
jgi:hypothetical protein